MNTKPRVIKDFEKLDEKIREQIKLAYPYGFAESLVFYNDIEGKKRTALPFETDDRYYLVRMTELEAVQIIDEDEDFDEEGTLKDEIREEFEEKYTDEEFEVNEEQEEIKDIEKESA